ncbi:hypothetical protein RM704_10485 [Streptomyces sp. DSM 3412]|uniref:Uncharacterized protein n=1 Tax=Streptomyces gottesmaniae TaxID=3075518 RepID=A0ABU2YV71_9ACTN|nr:hypothetical protein [Streptomyces sp. DSM 3412]MDT0567891.1 hypothetical protein [Streptomyces sp. DSM 3412]
MLVTSFALGAGNIGFAAGIFASNVGDLSLYAATGTGTVAAAAAFGIGMSVATFLKKDSQN